MLLHVSEGRRGVPRTGKITSERNQIESFCCLYNLLFLGEMEKILKYLMDYICKLSTCGFPKFLFPFHLFTDLS